MSAMLDPRWKKPNAATQAGLYYARRRQRLLREASNEPTASYLMSATSFNFTGETLADLTGNGNTGSLTGISSGNLADGALVLNGSSYIETKLSLPNVGAMGIWVYPTAYADWQSPCGWKTGNGGDGYALFDNHNTGNPGNWRFVFAPTGTQEVDIEVAAPITQNAWQYLFAQWAYQYGQWSFSFFLNNVLVGTGNVTGAPAENSGPFAIGTAGSAADNNYTGTISDCNVWAALPDATTRAQFGAAFGASASYVSGYSPFFGEA